MSSLNNGIIGLKKKKQASINCLETRCSRCQCFFKYHVFGVLLHLDCLFCSFSHYWKMNTIHLLKLSFCRLPIDSGLSVAENPMYVLLLWHNTYGSSQQNITITYSTFENKVMDHRTCFCKKKESTDERTSHVSFLTPSCSDWFDLIWNETRLLLEFFKTNNFF